MGHFFTTELGRMRTEEAIARADRYRLVQQAQIKKERDALSRRSTFAYRRALAAVGLSALMAAVTATAAIAYPAGPGPNIASGTVDTFAEARESVPQGDVGARDTYTQAREGTVADTGSELLTFAEARESAVREADLAVPYRGARVFDPAGDSVPAGTFAQAREAMSLRDAQWKLENFIATGYYVPQPAVERGPYVALGSRHNADALERMMDPVAVAHEEGRTLVDDSGISLATAAAVAALLLLVFGGLMVAVRDRELPRPV
jgi:hypothetical protein